MKNYFILLLIAASVASFSACTKDDTGGGNVPVVDKKYNVEYKFEVNENHGDVNLVYYDASGDKKTVKNPTSPWQMDFADFKENDSVFFSMELFPLANTTLSYNYSIKIIREEDGQLMGYQIVGPVVSVFRDSIPPFFNPIQSSFAFKIIE